MGFFCKAEQTTIELSSERSLSQKLEGEKAQLERHNKDMKVKLSELETELKTKVKATQLTLETKIKNLEEALDVETR